MRRIGIILPLLLILGAGAAARPAEACEKAGQNFVLVLDRTTQVGLSSTYYTGDFTTYTVHCASPNSPIYWSSTLNGVSTGEVNAFYGQYTDGNGHWSGTASSPWQVSHLGTWTKTANVGGLPVTVPFVVAPKLTVSNSVDGGPLYTVGQFTTYTISGAPPNTAISWSSTLNGVSTGENHAFYNQYTDASGNWSATAGSPWQSAHVGGWTKTAFIGSAPATTVSFQVIPSVDPVAPPAGTTVFNDFSNRTGLYDWTFASLIDDGANQAATIGSHALHMLFSAACNPQGSLTNLLYSAPIQEAINNANLKSFVLTTFDRTACGNNAKTYVDPTLYDDVNAYNAVVADYRDLTENLYQLYHGTGKTFIVSNWEGDNAVYCSGAYAYATDATFRAACDANYPVFYRGVPNPATGLNGFKRWLQARRQGITDGRSWAAANGLTSGVDVSFAIEFNIVNSLKQPACSVTFNPGTCLSQLNCTPAASACPAGTYPSVLCDVIPLVGYDYVSYSAYESTNVSPAQLTSDLNRVRTFLGTSNVIIGEFGFNQADSCATAQNVRQRTHNTLQAALSWGVPFIFQWVLFDNNQFGVYNYALQPQAMACYYQNRNQGLGYPWGSCN
ncbi:MAG TPA: hypothetical protein VF173_21355 [Thermoanaerobaculia bacterium]|nr:hypothetical protein [Thermoanaerobaculia bacterium]